MWVSGVRASRAASMEETREEKLKRWLEEKKAAKRAADSASSTAGASSARAAAGGGNSSVKRTRPAAVAAPAETPKASGAFARFEQQTPLQRNSRASASSALKTPQQQQQQHHSAAPGTHSKQWADVTTPHAQQQRPPDDSVTEQSLDRRRRLLERTTLTASSAVKTRPPDSAAKTSTVRKMPRPTPSAAAAASVPQSASKQQPPQHKSGDAEGPLSARRREAVSRAAAARGPVDMHDLQQLRDHLAVLETVLLQWCYLNVRLDGAVARQQRAARDQLLRVWADMHATRAQTLALSVDVLRERGARTLHTQLDAQYRHLLPMGDTLLRFLDSYAQLSRSVYSTTHSLPVDTRAPVDVASVQRALTVVDTRLTALLDAPAVAPCLEYGRSVTALTQLVTSEYDVLAQCRALLVRAERALTRKRSVLVHMLMQRDADAMQQRQ